MSEIVSKAERASQLRDRQREWLQRCLAYVQSKPDFRNATMTTLATLAGLNKNTLTRFMNKESYRGALSTPTISEISTKTGFPVTPEVYGETAETAGRNSSFRESEAEPYTAAQHDALWAAVKAAIAGRPHMAPWTLRSRALDHAGFRPGDVLLVDLNGQARAGDVVCAQIYDWQTGSAETVFRVFEPPFLVALSSDETFLKPRLLDDESVSIRGVMELQLRRRAAAR